MARAHTSASACEKKVSYQTEGEARTHLDLLLLSQPHGGAHMYRCDACGQFHLAGRPSHVYGGREPRWKKRQRRKGRRRHDEDPEPVLVGRNWFVGEVEEMNAKMGADPHASTLFDAHLAGGTNMARENTLDDKDDDQIAGENTAPAHLGDEVIHPTPQDPTADTIGHRGADFAWIGVDEITVDPTYQRAISPSKVNAIVEGFDIDVFGVVYLAQREDGTLVALDGQHRVAAVRDKFGPDATKKIPCFVLRNLAHQDEARIYYKMNRHRLQPTAFDGFRARLVFGDEVAVAIKKILDDRGLMVRGGMTQAVLRFNEVQAIAETEVLYRAEWLEEVLDVIGDAWMGQNGAHRASYLKGVRVFLETFYEEFYGEGTPQRVKDQRRTRLVDTLATLGPSGLDNRAKFYAESIGARTAVGMARGIHARFNTSMRGVARLPMWGETGVIEDAVIEEG
jgi:hypothetical protein